MAKTRARHRITRGFEQKVDNRHFYTAVALMDLLYTRAPVVHVTEHDSAGREVVFGRVMPSRLH